ncbi:MAG TPA: SpoIIE family protein phosphatase [Terracidiphilus sp.]|nr:SpoIIE family protein phosphatase [Terracidiphilus sp.]
MRKAALVFLLLAGAIAPEALRAQSVLASQSAIRFHYSDNPAWASPSFDDSGWRVALDGQVPQPPFRSDGYVWIRARIPVPPGVAGPLGVQSFAPLSGPAVQQIFVNGVAAGQYGVFPPHDSPRLAPRSLTFPIPAGVAVPGDTAVVAIRAWTSPIDRIAYGPSQAAVSIDRLSVLTTAARADLADAFLAILPSAVPSLLLFFLGIALLAIFRRAASRELQLNAVWLITLPLYLILENSATARLLSFLTAREWMFLYTVVVIPGFWVTPELLWTVFRFRDRLVRALAHATWIVFLVTANLASLPSHPASWISMLYHTSLGSLTLFNVICLGADFWALFVSRHNRIIAAAFSIINITYLLAIAGVPLTLHIGPVRFESQVVGFVVAGLTITAMLVYRAVAAWRAGQQLRSELAAAREIQQKLVPIALPPIAQFSLHAAYIPAAEVGGDFYQILPQQDGSSLLVIGDVSGKGLHAAMKGALAIGALRAFASENLGPADLLSRLNRELCSTGSDGFITCLCARIAAHGVLALANAGHLSPYRNGEEVRIESGLPLGIATGAEYSETTLQLAPRDHLTFLSDGVVEARNALGQLFGFDRTRDLSTQSAEAIAHAAQAHGQEDDITVLTVQFAPAGVPHA